jgi:hypothetical protein
MLHQEWRMRPVMSCSNTASALSVTLCVGVCCCCAVFDPRFPHGVRPVAGTRDPQQGRLVLHGEGTAAAACAVAAGS